MIYPLNVKQICMVSSMAMANIGRREAKQKSEYVGRQWFLNIRDTYSFICNV